MLLNRSYPLIFLDIKHQMHKQRNLPYSKILCLWKRGMKQFYQLIIQIVVRVARTLDMSIWKFHLPDNLLVCFI